MGTWGTVQAVLWQKGWLSLGRWIPPSSSGSPPAPAINYKQGKSSCRSSESHQVHPEKPLTVEVFAWKSRDSPEGDESHHTNHQGLAAAAAKGCTEQSRSCDFLRDQIQESKAGVGNDLGSIGKAEQTCSGQTVMMKERFLAIWTCKAKVVASAHV